MHRFKLSRARPWLLLRSSLRNCGNVVDVTNFAMQPQEKEIEPEQFLWPTLPGDCFGHMCSFIAFCLGALAF